MLTSRAAAEAVLARVSIGDDAELTAAVCIVVAAEVTVTVYTQKITLHDA